MIRRLIISLALALASFAPVAGDAATKPSFSIADVSAPESAASVTLTISKSAVASSYSKVTITTADGTARAGVDYQPVSTSITFGNKQLSAVVPVPLILRPGYQGNRAFTARIAVTRNGVVSRSTATVTILETEQPPAPTPSSTWTKCATETLICYVVGTANVRYGSSSTWTAPRLVTGSILCDNSVFGDPLVGTVKECETDGQVGTAPSPVPTPTPPPPATQTCPDGSIIPATGVCPIAPPPPPPSGSWVAAPLTVGGYACNKLQAGTTNVPPCGAGVVYRITGSQMSADAEPVMLYSAVFYVDASGKFPASDPYDAGFVGYYRADDLQGLAPQ